MPIMLASCSNKAPATINTSCESYDLAVLTAKKWAELKQWDAPFYRDVQRNNAAYLCGCKDICPKK